MPNSKRTLLVCLALVAAIVSIYAYTWHCEFIDFDDTNHITENPGVNRGLTGEGVKGAFTQFHAAQWIPLTWISHMADVSLFGLDAGAHHLVAVALHTLNACLLLLALYRLTGQFWPSAAVAALFAVHPMNVESVAWVSERKNLLSTMFWFLALIAYSRYVRKPSFLTMALVAFCMAAGLLCKGMLVTLPCVLLLLDFWPLERWRSTSWRRLVAEKLPLFALAIAASLVTSRAAVSANALVPLDVTPLSYRLANAAANYGIYAEKLLFPLDLSVLYPLPKEPPYALAIVSTLAIVLALYLGWRWRTRAPFVLVGLLWFLGVLVPVSGLVQVGKNVLADRFTYVPQIGFFIVIVWSIAAAVRQRESRLRPVIYVGSAVLLCLGIRSFQYVRHWKDSASIFAEAALATEDNSIAHANAGFALARKGALKGAIAHYRRSLEITPADPEVRTNLGAALSRSGQSNAAVAEFTQVLRDDPNHFEARLNLATHLIKERQPDKAIEHLNMLLERPDDPYLVNYWLGRAWADAGDKKRAVAHYELALRLRPSDARTVQALREVQGL